MHSKFPSNLFPKIQRHYHTEHSARLSGTIPLTWVAIRLRLCISAFCQQLPLGNGTALGQVQMLRLTVLADYCLAKGCNRPRADM